MNNVTAVLGPTNTGKTHLAVERMLGHETGMIGLPLRLLAREVYDRIEGRVAAGQVALVTGEEKIVPPEPRYWVCTVEAMPPDIEVDFLAIDEIQLAADPDRGHIFTDRMLHRRGTHETMLLGAATMRPLIQKLLPGTNFVTRPRFSRLTYSGQKKITRLPPRTAVVCFSAETVYAIAELIRRQRGGAAVVLGALSPRTRNAQVALYQNGDVDFMVATDAIGMGLNMDVDHVAFAQARKFDGFAFRDLTPAELAQIAGRAGRHMNDGTFGVTGEVKPFDNEIVDRIESHEFEPLRILQWRNRTLDFGSLDGLIRSLAAAPDTPGLVRARANADVEALEFLAREDEIRDMAASPAALRTLWDVCQLPDYRNITGAEHANLVGRLYRFLMTDRGVIPDEWFARQLAQNERTDGDIDTLANRIAHVRTWTFIANRSDWLDDPAGWQDKTRAIEDKLSDALHERLAQRFVDRRTSVLMKRMREKEDLMTSVKSEGDIHVEGVFVGHLKGFRFMPETSSEAAQQRALRAASMKAVAAEISERARGLAAEPDGAFSLARNGVVVWREAEVARLVAGDHILRPRVQLIADEQLTGPEREAVQTRLDEYLHRHVANTLGPLVQLDRAEDLEGLARGVAFRLVERLGIVPREAVRNDVQSLDQTARAALRRHGVRFGAFHIFVPALLKPAATALKEVLWGLKEEEAGRLKLDDLPAPPGQGLTSAPFDQAVPEDFYRVIGFMPCGQRIVRIDMLERLADLIRPRVFWRPERDGEERPEGSVDGGGFTVIPDMMSLVGCSGEEFAGILQALGFRRERRTVPAVPAKAAPSETASADATSTQAAPAESPAGDAPAADASTADAPAADAPAAKAPAGDAPSAEPEAKPATDASETDAPAEGVAEAAAETPAPETGEAAPASEAAPAPSTPEVPAPQITAPETAGASQDGGETAADAPEETIEVWWPKDAGPFRKRGQGQRGRGERRAGQGQKARNKGQGRPPRKAQGKGAGKGPDKGPAKGADKHGDPRRRSRDDRQRPPRQKPGRKPEKKADPDSPFAVLGALKAELDARKKEESDA
ncbi:helicase-related protein [Kaustia mangrovi]|nr:DEAD/DEAH box helicase [Kaustia mangrovi]